MSRTVCWFSCGAASAVATKIAIDTFKDRPLVIAYCGIVNEHPDNERFLKDCERWFGRSIVRLGNDEYKRDIYEVFDRTDYLVGPKGAACTRLLKKEVRRQFERPGDRQVFGYTLGEEERLDAFIDANNGVDVKAPLISQGLDKSACLAIIAAAGIELPAMYRMGYRNNNCIGCVKGGVGYWNKIRVDFPEVFERMAQQEEKMGRTMLRVSIDGKRQRVPLRKLDPEAGRHDSEPDFECGIACEMAIFDYADPNCDDDEEL